MTQTTDTEHDFHRHQDHPEPEYDCLRRKPLGWLCGSPIIEVDRLEAFDNGSGNAHAVIEDCPICGETHRHGFDGNQGDTVSHISMRKSTISHRCGHCHRTQGDVPGGYYLIYTVNTVNCESKDGEWVFTGEP